MSIYDEILKERARQAQLKHEGKFDLTPSDPEASEELCSTILQEEVGEVARAVLEKKPGDLRTELVQVMAVCHGWVERLDAQG